MRILTFSRLYPNGTQPRNGLFVEHRLRELVRDGGIEARVVAPVPWFPARLKGIGRFGVFAHVPRREIRNGIDVEHPRFFTVPGLGRDLSPFALAVGSLGSIRSMMKAGFDPEIIDAHYFYPDGVAAALLGLWLRKPVVITARGSDINLFGRLPIPRRQIVWAAKRSAAIITVSRALRDRVVQMGIDDSGVEVLRNGVDLQRFKPMDPEAARRRLNLPERPLLCVGNLVPEKGHALAIEALVQMPEYHLVIAGEGPLRGALEHTAGELGVRDRVQFVGGVDHAELVWYYNAAEALVLTSEREGMPNVVLEALSCGTPVVGAAVGGVPEVVADRRAGVLFEHRSPGAVAEAVRALKTSRPGRDETRGYAERFGWKETTQGQLGLFERVRSAARSGGR